jgi:putative flippase GtrA
VNQSVSILFFLNSIFVYKNMKGNRYSQFYEKIQQRNIVSCIVRPKKFESSVQRAK